MPQITNYTRIGEGSYGTIYKYEDPGVVKCIRLPKKNMGVGHSHPICMIEK